MVGPYWYYTYHHGRLVRRRSYTRHIHHENSNDRYKYVGKKRLVKPIYKKGLHRFSKPWKNYKLFSFFPGRYRRSLPCGYSRNQLWIALCRAWNAFTIWKQRDDIENMMKYGKIIHNLQRKLNLPLTEFDIIFFDSFEDESDDDDDGFDDYGVHREVPRISNSPKTDQELLAEIEEPIYYSDTEA